jgi:hypothetical protein
MILVFDTFSYFFFNFDVLQKSGGEGVQMGGLLATCYEMFLHTALKQKVVTFNEISNSSTTGHISR